MQKLQLYLIIGVTLLLLFVLFSFAYQQPNRQTDVEENYLITLMGDSLGAGVGASSEAFTFSSFLLEEIKKQQPNATLQNLSISGAKVGDVVTSQLPELTGSQPKLIFIIVGTNDITNQIPLAEFEKSYRELIAGVATFNAKVIVSNVPKFASTGAVPLGLRGIANSYTDQFNEVIGKIVQDNGIILYDLHTLSEKKLKPGSTLLSEDQFHPNDAGYKLMAAEAAKLVQ